MKKSNNLYGQKGKVLFTSAAAIALSLVAANPDKVSAATQPTNQAAKKTANIAKKRVTKKAALQPTTLTTENSSEAVLNDSSNEEENSPATDKNEVDSSSDLSATESNDTPAKIEKRDSAPAERTVSGQVNGLNLSYNQDTDELSINGGAMVDNNGNTGGISQWIINGNDGTNIPLAKTKKISITAATKLSGYATSGFFSNLAELTEITGLNLLDTSQATSMASMFANCPKLTSLDLSSLVTSNVTDMAYMFQDCPSLRKVNLQGFDTGQVIDMTSMFKGDSALTAINLSSFKTPKLQMVPSMFQGCSALTEFTFPSTTPSLTATYSMFQDCTSLRRLDISMLDLVTSKFMNGNTASDKMLGNLPNLSTLVLGSKTALCTQYQSPIDWSHGLDSTGGIALDSNDKEPWRQVDTAHGGTVFEPKGKVNLSLKDLTELYAFFASEEFKDFPTDTYVRLSEPITLHHVDENGKSIMSNTVFRGPIGDSYSLNAEQIPGYNLVGGDKTFSGNYGDKREVTAIYAKIPAAVTTPVQAADVTVHYQDENGKTIAPDEVLKGNVGDGYISMAKTISGYTLKARPDNATGFFSASPQSVTYVYAQEGTASAAEIAANGKGKGKNSKNSKNGKTLNNKPTAKGKTNSHLGLVPTGVNQLTSSASSSQASAASSSDPGHLPQTGTDKKTQIAVISAGAALLLSSLAGIWFSRKKN
ncbi:BspA family leucine-rich repeat surface protein [Lactobacillus panisapium]|uniref:BspA family leucine-rich repeat surface protein n=1 Tax=Lactobacillus panisapium TaxID=2012495 RepID=UPI001C696DEE|nr:BspA family leucine-rich repeat surface protein [Lactobacillus panisapium]QYN59417.1 BspA family leucine-rich repeat surface protein [Lactobacillus panisapium]